MARRALDGRPGRRGCPVQTPGPGSGQAPPLPGAAESRRRGRGEGGLWTSTLFLSSGQSGERVASCGGGQLRGGPAGLSWHWSFRLLTFKD
uniref:Uncharacterized protein n=1 Tax=Rhinopithecus roxellana TaxID=61622 RepID=A0A2K6PNI5_RHIRO